MTSFLLAFVVLSAPGIFGAARFSRRYEETLPITVFSTIFLLYVFGLADMLRAGFLLAVALWAGLGCAGVFWAVARRRIRETARLLLTPAAVFFAVFLAVIAMARLDFQVSEADEFNHWARVAKTTFLSHKVSVYTPFHLAYRSYPPGASLLQYFVLSLRPKWNEAVLYYCQAMLYGTLFLPFLKRAQWRDAGSIVTILLLVPRRWFSFPFIVRS